MRQVDYMPPIPPRPSGAHKGTFGTVIVVGGCETMIGAPAIAARAALRAGAGLVKIACPQSILPHAIGIEPCATGIGLDWETKPALSQIEQADSRKRAVLAVGPGMGQDERNGALVTELVRGPRPVVLDADGLHLLASQLDEDPAVIDNHGPLLLTPHPGEFNHLADVLGIPADPTDAEQRLEAAAILAQELECVVLLKGTNTVIAESRQFAVNPTGNAALSTAGSGDVLTGIIASLIAQGMDLFNAARLGAYVHGFAGDQWAEQHGKRGLRAIELADWLPMVFKGLEGR